MHGGTRHLLQGSTPAVNSLTRVFPFVWPSRRQLFLSFLFALLVALLWGAVLSIAYPVVKVLLQDETPAGHIQKQIRESEEKILHAQIELKEYEARLVKAVNETEKVSILRKKARAESRLTSASQRLAALRWIEVFVIPRLPADRFRVFTLILALLLVITLLKLVCMFAEEVLVGSVVQLTVMRVRKECFRRVLALDYQTLKMQGTSELMSRFTYDVEALGSGLGLLGGKLIREPLKALACVCFAFWVNWQLMLLSVLFVPVAALVFHRIGTMLKKAGQQ